MRYLTIVALLLCIANVYQLCENRTLHIEREALIKELNTLRNADNIAIFGEQRAREKLSEIAKVQRDELGKIDSTMSIDDLLNQCRRGMFGKTEIPAGSDATRSIDNAVSKAGSTDRPENRK